MKRSIFIFCIILAGFFILSSCKKMAFLNEIPSNEHHPISNLGELQALLDKEVLLCTTPVLTELSADCYYLKEVFWNSLNKKERMGYIWSTEIYEENANDDDWNVPYEQVFYCNVVLQSLTRIAADDPVSWNEIKGAALFIRAYAFYNLAQVFALPYDKVTASSEMGIPLKLTEDVNEETKRATIKETYDQVIKDLLLAKTLLPANVNPQMLNRPSKTAADAMLARVYLSMQNYQAAYLYADSCLQRQNSLMDYNDLDCAATFPFSRLNEEAIYQTRLHSTTDVFRGFAGGAVVDSTLYRSYALQDLRKQAFYFSFFDSLPYTKGSYYGSLLQFTGLATDEVYFTRAECNARLNNTEGAINDLNTVLEKRWERGTFMPRKVPGAGQALQLILEERKKELAFRGTRWTDIRRLNKEGYGITLTRNINGMVYTLEPEDKRYALPIPPYVIAKSGIPQNPR